ncbi:MAG: Fic family protein [Bacteroidaceae bacterium]|nr:Fic family protein [Bacteroidaceae bacterium]
MFEQEIETYELVREEYQKKVTGSMGRHEKLIARIPQLMTSTEQAIKNGQHPMVVAARFHGYFEYLHPFRDGNGRTGRLLSNLLLLRANHPLLIIEVKDRNAYIESLKMIRTDGTDEHLIALFFQLAINRMKGELEQKAKNSRSMFFF